MARRSVHKTGSSVGFISSSSHARARGQTGGERLHTDGAACEHTKLARPASAHRLQLRAQIPAACRPESKLLRSGGCGWQSKVTAGSKAASSSCLPKISQAALSDQTVTCHSRSLSPRWGFLVTSLAKGEVEVHQPLNSLPHLRRPFFHVSMGCYP